MFTSIFSHLKWPGIPQNSPGPVLPVLLPGPGTRSLIPQDREREAKTGNSKFTGTGSRQGREVSTETGSTKKPGPGPGADRDSQF